jgi:endonuclease YncB( thermonuclease family)
LIVWCFGLATAGAQNEPRFAPLQFIPALSEAPDVIDGDTLWIGIHEIRLFGVDAIEDGQTCTDAAGRTVDCFKRSREELVAWVAKPGFHCIGMVGKNNKPRRSYGRYLATCKVGDVEVNTAMVESGWAFAAYYVGDARRGIKPCGQKGADAFQSVENTARTASRGLHALKVDLNHPCRWRSRNNRDCPNAASDSG